MGNYCELKLINGYFGNNSIKLVTQMIQDIQAQDTSFQSSGRSWDNCKSSRYYQLALYCGRLSNSYVGVWIRKTYLFKNPWKIGYKNVLFFTKKVKMLYFFQKECLKKYHHQILYYWCYYCEERKESRIVSKYDNT